MFWYIYYNWNCSLFLNIKYDPDFIAAYSVWCSGFGDSWWVQSVHGTTSKMCTQQFEWKWCWCFPLFWIYPLLFCNGNMICFRDFLRLAPIFTEEHKKLLLNICNSVVYHIQFDRVFIISETEPFLSHLIRAVSRCPSFFEPDRSIVYILYGFHAVHLSMA